MRKAIIFLGFLALTASPAQATLGSDINRCGRGLPNVSIWPNAIMLPCWAQGLLG